MNVILCVKKNKPNINEIRDFLQKYSRNLNVFEGEVGQPLPAELNNMPYDILISYLSPWIIPVKVLCKAKLGCINFHPGPPEYPGIGCFNFALYNNEKVYGVTAHIMAEKVDTGRIIGVKRFNVNVDETVYSLSCKSYEAMRTLFTETMKHVLLNGSFPKCGESWKRPAYKRKELEDLCRITPDMPEEEIKRRVRATVYPNMPGPYLEFYGNFFEYAEKREKA